MNLTAKLTALLILVCASAPAAMANCNPLLDFQSKRLHSKQVVNFCEAFKGKTLLVVNTASRCGFTPQFTELEELYQKYQSSGLEIVGFPSNSFRQELPDEKSTAEVCYKNYGVSFTMLAPSDVIGPNQNAFYKRLNEQTQNAPNWNFNKYLISANSKDIKLFRSNVSPLNSPIEEAVRSLLE